MYLVHTILPFTLRNSQNCVHISHLLLLLLLLLLLPLLPPPPIIITITVTPGSGVFRGKVTVAQPVKRFIVFYRHKPTARIIKCFATTVLHCRPSVSHAFSASYSSLPPAPPPPPSSPEIKAVKVGLQLVWNCVFRLTSGLASSALANTVYINELCIKPFKAPW
jgi:hypothetical protein